MTASAPPPPPPAAPAVDDTQVVDPGLHDATRVQAPAPLPPPPGTESPFAPPAAPAGPWGPSSQAAPPDGPPTTAPWNPPAAPPPPTWQQPAAPPDAATYNPSGQPPLGGAPGWAPPGAVAPAAWGAGPVMAPPKPSTKSPLGGAVALIGAALTIVGVFSGWVTLNPGGNSETVTGWSLVAGKGVLKSTDPVLIVALAVVSALLGVLLFAGVARTLVRVATVLAGIGIVVVVVLNWVAIARYVTDNLPSSFQAKQAIGYFMAIGGGILVAIAGLLPAKK